jgi:hypothetical protein
MNGKVVLILGSIIGVIIVSIPFIYSGMKQNDYNNLYHGIQDAKRRAGVWIEEDFQNRKLSSYSDRYVHGDY